MVSGSLCVLKEPGNKNGRHNFCWDETQKSRTYNWFSLSWVNSSNHESIDKKKSFDNVVEPSKNIIIDTQMVHQSKGNIGFAETLCCEGLSSTFVVPRWGRSRMISSHTWARRCASPCLPSPPLSSAPSTRTS